MKARLQEEFSPARSLHEADQRNGDRELSRPGQGSIPFEPALARGI